MGPSLLTSRAARRRLCSRRARVVLEIQIRSLEEPLESLRMESDSEERLVRIVGIVNSLISSGVFSTWNVDFIFFEDFLEASLDREREVNCRDGRFFAFFLFVTSRIPLLEPFSIFNTALIFFSATTAAARLGRSVLAIVDKKGSIFWSEWLWTWKNCWWNNVLEQR